MWVSTARRGPTRSIQRQRLLEVAVRRMRLVAQAVDDPQLDPGERRERGLVELDHIGRIGEAAEAEAERRAEAVVLRERHDSACRRQ